MNPKRSRAQILSAVSGFIMMSVSAPCVLAMISDLITKADNITGALIVGSFMAFVGIAGLALFVTGLKKPTASDFVITQQVERDVLGLAREHGGRLTVAEVALGTSMTLDQCQRILEHFEHNEAVRTHLSSDGDIVYVFPGFTVDKASAIDPLDDAAVFDAELAAEEEVQFEHPQEVDQESW